MRTLFDNARVDRTALSKAPLVAQGHDRAFWLRQSPRHRQEQLEILRQLTHDNDPDTARLSRVYRPVKRPAG
jgi:hypothetical protein